MMDAVLFVIVVWSGLLTNAGRTCRLQPPLPLMRPYCNIHTVVSTTTYIKGFNVSYIHVLYCDSVSLRGIHFQTRLNINVCRYGIFNP